MFTLFSTIVGYLFLVVLCTTFLLLSLIALIICYPFDRGRRVVHELSRIQVYIFFCCFRWMWKYSIEGLENLDPNGRYIIMINHNAMMDIPCLYYVPLNFRWVSKREVFAIPFFGQFLLLHGDIAIERGNPKKAMDLVTKRGLKWIGRGASVAMFPEGTRSKTGEIGRFKSGGFRLAKEAQVEILPVVIDGTRKLLNKKGMLVPRQKIRVRVLPPVSVSRVENTEQRDLMEEVRSSMIVALDDMRG